MKLLTKLQRFEGFELSWKHLLALSISILLLGGTLTLASIIKPDIIILSARGFSWLPASGIVLLALGLLECLDAFLAKERHNVLQNLQVGVLDAVIGTFIIFSVSGYPEQLSILIGAFLIARGIVRITLTYMLYLPNTFSTAFGGLISIILGICAWQEWPNNSGWFLAFCLNVEITARGWAMTSFALWIRKQKITAETKTQGHQ